MGASLMLLLLYRCGFAARSEGGSATLMQLSAELLLYRCGFAA